MQKKSEKIQSYKIFLLSKTCFGSSELYKIEEENN